MTEDFALGSYLIREIGPGDVEQLAAAHTAILKATYPGMVDQNKLDALAPAESVTRWQSIAASPPDTATTVRTRCAVHTRTDQIAGFATAGTPRDENPPTATELWSLNVLPSHHGTGLAAELMVTVLGGLDVAAYLWVATGNARAISFYRKHRFEFDGTSRFDSDWACHESRMTRAKNRTGFRSVHQWSRDIEMVPFNVPHVQQEEYFPSQSEGTYHLTNDYTTIHILNGPSIGAVLQTHPNLRMPDFECPSIGNGQCHF